MAWSDCDEWPPGGHPTSYLDAFTGMLTRKGLVRRLPGDHGGAGS